MEIDSLNEDRFKMVYQVMLDEMSDHRNRMEKFTITFATLMVVLISGWWNVVVHPENQNIGMGEKAILTAIIIVFATLFLWIRKMVKDYYLEAGGVVNKIERKFGCFEKGRFIEGEVLFPSRWKNFGTNKWKEATFQVPLWVTIVLSILAILFIWLIN